MPPAREVEAAERARRVAEEAIGRSAAAKGGKQQPKGKGKQRGVEAGGEGGEEVKKDEEKMKSGDASTGQRGWRLLLGMIAGSQAFNLALPSSDADYFGVYAGDVDEVLSLTQPVESIDSHEPDIAIYEAAKFCAILLKGNPKVIEPLFTDHLCWQSDEWLELKKQRHNYLTQVTGQQYFNYAKSQVDLKNPTPKQYYHKLRLLMETERVGQGGEPKVWFEDGSPEREFLMDVRLGKVPEEEIRKRAEDLEQVVSPMIKSLPAESDLRLLSNWLVSVRRKDIESRRTSVDLNAIHDAKGSGLQIKAQVEIMLQGEGTVLCCIPVGSKLHGLAEESSGDDYLVIYVAPTDAIVSLFPPLKRLDENDEQKGESYTPGILVLEAGYACSLLGAGNNRLVEAVFFNAEESVLPYFETKVWQELKLLRDQFINQTALANYVGVADGQQKVRPLGAMNLYHAHRLLLQAEEIMAHRRIKTTLTDQEVAFLRGIRQATAATEGTFSFSQLSAAAATKIEALRKRRGELPAPIKSLLNPWLVNLRHSQWRNTD